MYSIARLPSGVATGVIREADHAIVPLDEGNSDYRQFLEWNASQPEGERLSLEDQEPSLDYLKQQKRQELDAWLASEEAEGYVPAGYQFAMKMSGHDQTEFNKLDAGVKKLLEAGLMDEHSQVPIGAADGMTYEVSAAAWGLISVEYTAACFDLWRRYSTYRSQIESAATVADFDAIELV